MEVTARGIEGVWEFTPVLRPDDRGVFLESFKASAFEDAIGHPLDLQQMNISVSKAGTVRGIHFADVPPGQAKYVQCFAGRILDVVVDIRVGSPTFGQWDAVELTADSRNALYIAEGLGHAFCALTESVTVGYLCSEPYAPVARARHHARRPGTRAALARHGAAALPQGRGSPDAGRGARAGAAAALRRVHGVHRRARA